jgi:hypothetical protein
MTVIVKVRDEREAATAASPRSAPIPLHVAYAELTAWAGGCAIETGHIGALADNECKCERLPTDTTPPCGCWPQEVTKDPPFTLKEEPMPETTTVQTCDRCGHDCSEYETFDGLVGLCAACEAETEVASSDDELPPFIRGLVDDIDREIAKLVRARDALLQ